MQPFHKIDVSEMCGEVVLSQGVILTALCALGWGGGEAPWGTMTVSTINCDSTFQFDERQTGGRNLKRVRQ